MRSLNENVITDLKEQLDVSSKQAADHSRKLQDTLEELERKSGDLSQKFEILRKKSTNDEIVRLKLRLEEVESKLHIEVKDDSVEEVGGANMTVKLEEFRVEVYKYVNDQIRNNEDGLSKEKKGINLKFDKLTEEVK